MAGGGTGHRGEGAEGIGEWGKEVHWTGETNGLMLIVIESVAAALMGSVGCGRGGKRERGELRGELRGGQGLPLMWGRGEH